jgi:hypothetical protein
VRGESKALTQEKAGAWPGNSAAIVSKNILQKRPCCAKVFCEIAHLTRIVQDPRASRLAAGGDRRRAMEPTMCPFCGGTNLYQDDDYSLELDFEYWTIHHWECMECAQSFDKIDILPATNSFEEINESTIH